MKYLSFAGLRVKLDGRGRTTIYRDVAEGRLPKPIKLGGRLYWIESQVDEAMTDAQSETNQENAPAHSGNLAAAATSRSAYKNSALAPLPHLGAEQMTVQDHINKGGTASPPSCPTVSKTRASK